MRREVREPAVAGLFYPAEPEILRKEVQHLLHEATASTAKGKAIALVLPHAGYMYSGFTASIGYKLLSKKTFDTIVIVSPSHREYFNGISVYDGTAFKTPLGNLPIDQELADALVDDNIIIRSEDGHRKEHAIEVHLPFLQTLFDTVKILPIVMGDQRRTLCFYLGDKLAEVLQRKNVLLLASTDLSHYHTYEEANLLDKIVLTDIASFDIEKLMDDLETQRIEMCGGGPTVAVLRAAKLLGATRTEILQHCNSGDVTGEHDRVVGYLSAAAYKTH